MSKKKNPCEKCDKSFNCGGIYAPSFINREACNNCEDYKKYRKYLDARLFSKKNLKEYERMMFCIEHCIDYESEE